TAPGAEGHGLLFTGDAAKSRAELASRRVDMTLDEAASLRSLERVWMLWGEREGTLLVPGHDLPMVLHDGEPAYVGERSAAIQAWLGRDPSDVKTFDLR
ncbi:MAG: hypothetical protein KGM44_11725, partial [bacterium]|nr:hypothetical protein [bacterium]